MISSTLLSIASIAGAALAAIDCTGVKAVAPGCASQESLYQRDFFYIGGRYVPTTLGNLTYDQIYVEKLTPARGVHQKHPVVLFHGGGVSGAVSFLMTVSRKLGTD